MPINAFRFGHTPNSVEKKAPNNLENYKELRECYFARQLSPFLARYSSQAKLDLHRFLTSFQPLMWSVALNCYER
jgi:hypothetical protein